MRDGFSRRMPPRAASSLLGYPRNPLDPSTCFPFPTPSSPTPRSTLQWTCLFDEKPRTRLESQQAVDPFSTRSEIVGWRIGVSPFSTSSARTSLSRHEIPPLLVRSIRPGRFSHVLPAAPDGCSIHSTFPETNSGSSLMGARRIHVEVRRTRFRSIPVSFAILLRSCSTRCPVTISIHWSRLGYSGY